MPTDDAYLLATTQQSLAEALVARDGPSTRPRTLSADARTTFVALARTAELAQVDAWIARQSRQ